MADYFSRLSFCHAMRKLPAMATPIITLYVVDISIWSVSATTMRKISITTLIIIINTLVLCMKSLFLFLFFVLKSSMFLMWF